MFVMRLLRSTVAAVASEHDDTTSTHVMLLFFKTESGRRLNEGCDGISCFLMQALLKSFNKPNLSPEGWTPQQTIKKQGC